MPPQHPAGNGERRTGAMEPGEKFQVKRDKRFQICKTRAEGRQRCLVLPAFLGQGVELAPEGEVDVKLWENCWSCGGAAPKWIEQRGCRVVV